MHRLLHVLCRPLLTLLGALALIAVSLVAVPGQAYAAVPTPSTDHPFSDPVYLPLRKPATIGCTKTFCDNGPAHGFWAIDFIGTRGDPIYAAGAGIAHIGGNSGQCSTSDESERGRWVWVDHGGGVVTHYRHLDTIIIKEGQAVTPYTQLGTMGGSGSTPPYCSNAYLHFEIRVGGNTGTPVSPGTLISCAKSGPVSLPGVWGARDWDDPKAHTRPRRATPTGSDKCIGTPWLSTPSRPSLTTVRGDAAIGVKWKAAPKGTDSVTVLLQRYAPTKKQWSTPVYRTVPATTNATVFVFLQNGVKYRVSAYFHGSKGFSRMSSRPEVTPATIPGAPPGPPRFLTWPDPDYVHYGWERPYDGGSPVTKFTAARRCRVGSAPYDAWEKYDGKTEVFYINFRDLIGYTHCQVKVRAVNAVGTGPYSVTSDVDLPPQ
ncbi:MAG TPA: peptidoglycan DD-metalloendopeptidase family protein [Propionibacteriaceae bacterium]